MKYYVYAHIDPLTNEIFYIGKGTKDRSRSGVSRNTSWKRHVEFLQKQGLSYDVKTLHICETSDDALRKEILEIRSAVDSGKKILNRRGYPEAISRESLITDHKADAFDSAVAAIVREKRKKLKLTQVKLAEKAGVGLRFVRELEQGKKSLRMDCVDKVLWLFGYRCGPQKIEV